MFASGGGVGTGEAYDGPFIDNWEFIEGMGDLAQRNGIYQDDVYGYVVAETYPHAMGYFAGTPDPPFTKQRPE